MSDSAGHFHNDAPGDGICLAFIANWIFQFTCPLAAEPKRNETKHAEGTINQPPPDWNSAQPAEHERIGNHQHTGDQPEVKQPAVADGVAQRADENQRDDKMPERQPVRAVKKKRMLRLRLRQRITDAQKPVAPFRMNHQFEPKKFTNRFNSPCNGIAVTPLKTSPMMNNQVSSLMRRRKMCSRFMMHFSFADHACIPILRLVQSFRA